MGASETTTSINKVLTWIYNALTWIYLGLIMYTIKLKEGSGSDVGHLKVSIRYIRWMGGSGSLQA